MSNAENVERGRQILLGLMDKGYDWAKENFEAALDKAYERIERYMDEVVEAAGVADEAVEKEKSPEDMLRDIVAYKKTQHNGKTAWAYVKPTSMNIEVIKGAWSALPAEWRKA